MKKISALYALIFITLTVFLTACGASDGGQKAQPASVGALNLPDFAGWSAADVCGVLSTETVGEALGRPLKGDPQPFDDASNLGKGCAYDAGRAGANAYFAYISLAPGARYAETKRAGSNVRQVNDFGLEAFRVNGADAEQLWVKLSDDEALVVGIGDEPNPDGARLLAKSFLEKVGGNQ